MNYTEFKTTVEDYVEDSFSATDFATMTKLAEQKIYQVAQFPASRKSATNTLTVNSPYLSAPDDYLAPLAMAVISASGVYSYLLDKDVNFIREVYPNPTVTGTPRYYAMFGPQSADANELVFILGPTPSAALSVELHYFAFPESIVTASTTWLGDNCELALLKAIIYEAGIFMKEEADVMNVYKEEMAAAMAIAKQLIDGKNRQDDYRSGQYRAKVT